MGKNYKLDIAYDGTNYHGWQEQKENKNTVQSKLNSAIYAVTGETVSINASGRTDAGVHALNQVANVRLDTKIPAQKLTFAINAYLPDDIRVLNVETVDDGFDARFSAKKKTYIYRIYNSKVSNPFYKNYSLQVGGELDLQKMQLNAEMLIGEHDFTSFYKKVQGVEKNPVRVIYDSDISKRENMITFEITGNGFLYNMVRIISGTLIKIGLGKEDSSVADIMLKKDRIHAGPTAKPHGLFLKEVIYDQI